MTCIHRQQCYPSRYSCPLYVCGMYACMHVMDGWMDGSEKDYGFDELHIQTHHTEKDQRHWNGGI